MHTYAHGYPNQKNCCFALYLCWYGFGEWLRSILTQVQKHWILEDDSVSLDLCTVMLDTTNNPSIIYN